MTSLAQIVATSSDPETEIAAFMETAMKAEKGDTPTARAEAILKAAELERFIARDQFRFVVSGLARRLENEDRKYALQFVTGLGLDIANQ